MEEQLTMFDEVMHPLLKDIKCGNCGSKDVKISTDGKVSKYLGFKNEVTAISGCFSCNVCRCSVSFEVS